MMTTRERIAKILRYEKRATRGPWKLAKMGGLVYHGKAEEDTKSTFAPTEAGGYVFEFEFDRPEDLEISAAQLQRNLRFVTAARADVPWLCAELTDALNENERLRKALAYYVDAEVVTDWGMQTCTDIGHVARGALGLPSPHHIHLADVLRAATDGYDADVQLPDSAEGCKPARVYVYFDEEAGLREALERQGLVVTEYHRTDSQAVFRVNFAEKEQGHG